MVVDKLLGLVMLTVATAVFVYYTAWTFVLPFVDESHFITSLFPPREWAIRIPAALLLVGISVIGSFIGLVLVKSAQKEKAKQQAKKAK